MAIRNRKRELLGRIQCKNLDDRFAQIVHHGLECSPFETDALA